MVNWPKRGAKRPSGRRPTSEERLRGPWYVLWGARLLVGGLPIALTVGVGLLINACNGRFASVLVPGSTIVTLDPGVHSVYYEYPDSLPWSRTPEVEFELSSRVSDASVSLAPPREDESETQGSRVSVLLYRAEVSTPGVYELRAWYTRDDARPDIAVTIGRGPTERIQRAVVIVAVVVLGIAAWVLVAFLVSRYFHPPVGRANRAKRGR
jgi:hypothetical protein